MRKRKLKIFLTPTENSIVIQSLNHLRNALLRENRDTGCLDELLLKVMCAPVKYSLQGTTQGRYLTGGVPPVRFSM